MISAEWRHHSSISMDECMSMTPLDMARTSAVVQSAYSYLLQAASQITEPTLRQKVLQVLENPAPSFLQMHSNTERKRLRQMLLHSKAISENVMLADLFPDCSDPAQAPQLFWSAPGSSYDRHHSYPGGLAIHTAMNLKVSLKLCEAYQETYHCNLNRDIVVAGQILHDSQKPWILQWTGDGSCLQQITIAGEGAHHVLGLAESVHRGFAPSVVLAQACTHSHPGSTENAREIVHWIRTACLLVNKDPGELEQEIDLAANAFFPPMEWFVTYQGDHNWVLSLKAAQMVIEATRQVAKDDYDLEADSSSAHAFRNYLFSQFTILKLYEMLTEQGLNRFKYCVRSVIT